MVMAGFPRMALALAVCLSFALLVHLWLRRAGGVGQKLRWSVVLALPYLGPIFYVAFYVPPSIQPGHLQARENPDLWAAGL